MEELDPESRDALRRYRERIVLAPPARDRVRLRLEASMDTAEAAPRERPASPRRRAALVVLTALAAALLLALCDLRARLDDGQRPGDSVAPYTAPPAPGERTQPRAPATAPRPEPATVQPEPAPRRSPAPDLAAELAQLQRARAAIDAHDPDAALLHLGEHARRFPDGQMREDRQLLQVEALCARGDAPQARAEAGRFLRQFPGSPHADRVRSFCAVPVTERPPGGESSP